MRKTTKKTQAKGETRSKGRRQALGRNSMRQEKAEIGMTRLDKKWPKLKEVKLKQRGMRADTVKSG